MRDWFTASRQRATEPAYPLILDLGLEYLTSLGGSSSDWGSRIALDTAGNAYVTGGTPPSEEERP